MAKEAKLKGNVVEFTETKTWTEEVSSLEAEKQGCLNTIDSCRARVAEINSFLGLNNGN